MNSFSDSIFMLGVILGLCIVGRNGVANYERQVHQQMAREIQRAIDDPQVSVHVVGRTLVLKGVAYDEEDREELQKLAESTVSQPSFYEVGPKPKVINLLRLAGEPQTRPSVVSSL